MALGGFARSCEAIVLKATDYGEADQIVHLLSSDSGMLRGFARSSKKSKKRFTGSIVQFTTCQFLYQAGRGDLKVLTDSEVVKVRSRICGDIHAFALANYGVELLELLLLADEASSAIYSLLGGFLDFLDHGGDVACARLLFELRLVALLGYIPHLLHCSECFEVFRAADAVYFDALRGGALCQDCARTDELKIDPGTLGSLARSLHVDFSRYQGFKFSSQTLQEGEQLLALVYRNILPKEPKTLQFMAQLRGSRS